MTMRPGLLIVVLVACGLGACGGSDGPKATPDGGGGPADAGPPNMQSIGPAGGTVRLPGGEATLVIPPGALREVFDFAITAGTAPGSYDFAPAGTWFRLPATVKLAAPPMDGVYVGFTGGAIPVALESQRDAEGKLSATVMHLAPRYSVVPVMPLTTRDQAATLVRAGVVPVLFNPVPVVTGPMQKLPAGTVVRDHVPSSIFNENTDFTSGVISRLPANTYTLADERWFFWVDPLPTALFNHDGMWLLIHPERGTVLELPAHSWPRLSTEALPITLEERFKSPLTIVPVSTDPAQELKPPVAGRPAVSATMQGLSTAPNMCCRGTKVLIIRTADEQAFIDSETAVRNYLTNTSPGAGLDPFNITSVRAYDGEQIAAALDALASTPGMCWCDVLIYIVSHGDEGAFVIHPKAGTPPAEENPQFSHDDFIQRLGRICAQRLNVVVESCQAGTMHDIIAQARKRAATAAPGGNTERALRPYKCLNATITTAAKKGRSSFRGIAKLDAVLFGQPYPMGFTSAWVGSLTSRWHKDMPDDWGGAAADASNPSPLSAFLYWSSPESKKYTPSEDCCQCCGAPDGGTGLPPPTDGPSTTLPPPDASVTTPDGLKVSPIDAVFTQATFSTAYTALFTNPLGEPLTVKWSGPNCATYSPVDPTMTSAAAGQLAMTWVHPHPPCDATTDHSSATIKLEVTSPTASFECLYKGASNGAGMPCTKK